MKTFKIRIPVVKPRNANIYEVTLAQLVKNPPAMRETWVQSLGWVYLLEEGMATDSSIPAWRSPVNRGAWQVKVHGIAKKWTRLSN